MFKWREKKRENEKKKNSDRNIAAVINIPSYNEMISLQNSISTIDSDTQIEKKKRKQK